MIRISVLTGWVKIDFLIKIISITHRVTYHQFLLQSLFKACLKSFTHRTRTISGMFLSKLNSDLPFGIAPASPLRRLNPEVEIAAARTAEYLGIPFIQSVFSSLSIQDVGEIAPTTSKWMELYPFQDRRITEYVLKEVQQAGFEGLIVIINEFDDVKFAPIDELIDNHVPRIFHDLAGQGLIDIQNSKILLDSDAESTWFFVKLLTSASKIPITIKGVSLKHETMRALWELIDETYVTNQIDFSQLNNADRKRVPLIVSGDVIFEKDAAQMLNLGADLIVVERAIQWGYQIGGKEGIEDVINLYKRELIIYADQ